MEKGSGNSRWQPKPTVNSSPNNYITPVRAEVSSGDSVFNASGEKSHSSGKTVGHTSGSGTYINETPAGRRGGGWSACGSGSSSHGGSSRQWTNSNASDTQREERFSLKSGNSSSGEKDVNKINETPVGRQGRGWSTRGSGSSSHGGSSRQWTNSNASDSRREERFSLKSDNSSSGEGVNKLSTESSPVNTNCICMESLRLGAPQLSGKSVSEAKIQESTANIQVNETSESPIVKFDICPPRKSGPSIIKPSLHAMNKERRKENQRAMDRAKGEILRQGMVLLKSYLSTSEQASILNICRHHGLETVGFENPCFGEGGKMHLKLMCYGMSWDPKTNQYGDVRSADKAKPPPIHPKLLELVDRAVKDSQSLISENPKVKNVESILPSVKPDICLVNYYSHTGRLGLHQDRDESRESLNKGIPIVSFSIGDAAEFVYGDQRDVEKTKEVILESGDVLIFGGQARHIFHGVSKIRKDTAPKTLIGETNFRSGRLNLTFRQRF